MKCRGFCSIWTAPVDSLPAVERAWTHWGKRHAIDADEILNFIHGKQAITSLRHFMRGSSEEEIQQEFRLLEKTEAEDTDGVRALPGARDLLEQLNALEIPGDRHLRLDAGGLGASSCGGTAAAGPLCHCRAGENGKPEPDAYLTGAKLLGLKPEECVVVEDAPAGILSGLAAGCAVIAVNAPADTPRPAETTLQLTTLTALRISKAPDGTVTVLTQN